MKRQFVAASILAATLVATPVQASWYLKMWAPESVVEAVQPAPTPQPTQPAPEPAPAPQPTPTPAPTPVWGGGWAGLITQPAPAPQPTQPAPTPTQPAPAPTQIPVMVGLSAEESRMVKMVNDERINAGLRPLEVDHNLTLLARIKSHDLVDHKYFAHESPRLGNVRDLLRRYNVPFLAAGENLASGANVTTSHYRLMASDGHRRNILYRPYTHIGIGVVRNGAGVMVTQIFVQR